MGENSLSSAELEVNALNRRVQGLEGDLETCEDKLLLASQKLDKAATAADDSDRMRKVLESRANQDEESSGAMALSLNTISHRAAASAFLLTVCAAPTPSASLSSIIRIFSPHLLDTCMNEEIDK